MISFSKRSVVWALSLFVFFVGLSFFFVREHLFTKEHRSPVPPSYSSSDLHTRTGERLLSEERYDEALVEFTRALAENEDAGLVHYHIGRLHLMRGRYEEAEQELRRAIEANPNLVEAYNLFIQVILHRLQLSPSDTLLTGAITVQEQAVRLVPDQPIFHYNLGSLYLSAGRSSDAEREYLTALSVDSTLLPVYSSLGKLYRYQGKFDAARTIYERGLRLDPDNPDLLYSLGTVLEHSGYVQEAVEAYRRAVTIDPDLPKAHLNLGRLLVRIGRVVEGRTALSHFERTQQDDVTDLIPRIEATPDDLALHLRLAAAYARNRQLSEAEAVYRRVVDLSPSSVEPIIGLIATRRETGREASAESLLTVTLRRFPGHPRLLEEQALLFLRRRQYPDAIRLFTDLIGRFPDRGDLYLSLGRAEAKNGDFLTAAAHLQRALELLPDHRDLFIDLADLDLRLGKFGEAVRHGEEAVRRQPRSWKAYAVLGTVYTTVGRSSEGERALARAKFLRQSTAFSVER